MLKKTSRLNWVKILKINFIATVLVCLVSAFLYRRIMLFQEKDLDFSYAHLTDENSSAASVIDNRVHSDKKRVITLLAVAIVIIAWQGIWVPTTNYNYEKNIFN